MTARLVLLLLFIATVSSVFYLTSYRSSFQQQQATLTAAQWHREQAEFIASKQQHHDTSANPDANGEEAAVAVVIDMNNPDIKRGHEVYHQVGQCASCHGEQGEGLTDKQAPLIAGQHDWYVVSQLKAFKTKERINEAMYPYLEKISDADYEKVAKYIQLLRIK